MDSDSLPIRILKLLRENILVSALFIIGMMLLSVGLIQFFLSSSKTNDIEFQSGQTIADASESSRLKNIVVDVSGAVARPGVYSFQDNSRIQDALIAAGGLSAQADREYVAKSINLAALLKDGIKIYIPKVGENVQQIQSSTSNLPSDQSSISGISVNNASSQELDSLPGIGSVTAQKIINGRPYSSIEELQTRKIVSSKVFDEIKDKISL